MPFIHIDTSIEGYVMDDLVLLGLQYLFNKTDTFVLRVYRRGNFKDYVEHNS